MNIQISEIISAVGGRLLNDGDVQAVVTSISTDTRTIKDGALFVPIVGENFDGHDYIAQASEKGAICVLTERQSQPTDTPFPLIYVSCTRRALMNLANYYRRKHNIKVVAITGSAGKTTTKDMIADILSQKFRTKRTIKNFNNEIGMPLSIFQLEAGDEVLVLEMGMNHANEIHELSLAGVPDIAVITHIGDAHIENFENREGILHAKLEIVDGLREGGTVVLNGDDPLLTGQIAAEKTASFNVL
jgi:UDP-N-acetylmuramoyl-tripeptide--D-alanyl-D-alanine ligase